MIAAALDYANRGYPIVPMHTPTAAGCSCRKGAECDSPGKHPRINTGKGHSAASIDPDEVRQWWTRWPDANMSLRMGATTGMFALDVDIRHGGHESLIALEREYGPLPRTVEALTGGGGRHYLFAHPGEPVTCSGIGTGLDIKGDGGLLMVAPSLHTTGPRYRWIRHPEVCELADAPLWLLDKVLRRLAA